MDNRVSGNSPKRYSRRTSKRRQIKYGLEDTKIKILMDTIKTNKDECLEREHKKWVINEDCEKFRSI